MDRHYFDWAATSPLDTLPRMDIPFGNPSSRHTEGREARKILEDARKRCAKALGVSPSSLIFTSGGTEGNVAVLQSLLLRPGDSSLIHSAVEHPSVIGNAEVLRRMGRPVGVVGVGADGRVAAEDLLRCMERTGKVRMVAIMAVNNETGAIMDLPDINRVLRPGSGAPVHLHCDAVQAAGKVSFDLVGSGVDSAVFSAHKLGGPRGIGLLYLRKPLESLARGGSQEHGIRPGTENVAGAVAMADCLEQKMDFHWVQENHAAAEDRFARLISALRNVGRCKLIPEDRGDRDGRFSPYILQAAFEGIPAEVLVRVLDDMGIAISTGSACSSAHAKRPVLAAMGLDDRTAFQAVRFSQGWTTTEDDIDALIAAVEQAIGRLKA